MLVLSRFRLVDRIGEGAGSSVWRAYDERLKRPVGVRLIPLDDPRVQEVRARCADAARVFDRRAVPILDVVDDTETFHLVIVTEWLDSTPFGDYLAARGGEPLPPMEAAALALEVSRYLVAAHEEGATHGHLRPDVVMISDTGEVRIRGLGVDAALYGPLIETTPVLADVHGVGAILYAALTTRWPESTEVDGLPGVPFVEGRIPWPSHVVAAVPASLDHIAARALLTTPDPKGSAPFETADDLVEALSSVVARPAAVAPRVRPRRTALRVGSVFVFGSACVGLAGLGVSLLLGLGSGPLVTPREVVSASPTPSNGSPAPSGSPTGAAEQEFPIITVSGFDPYGSDHKENQGQAPAATDTSPTTAWHTSVYKKANMSGKPGVGLLIDLGTTRPVRSVQLRLVGDGTSLSLLATDDPTLAPTKFASMAEATNAGTELLLRVPRAVSTRYVIIWFTLLPPADSFGFQGGVADVRVLG